MKLGQKIHPVFFSHFGETVTVDPASGASRYTITVIRDRVFEEIGLNIGVESSTPTILCQQDQLRTLAEGDTITATDRYGDPETYTVRDPQTPDEGLQLVILETA